eukprot:4060773-Pleurochrysis_carterae.AAC.4
MESKLRPLGVIFLNSMDMLPATRSVLLCPSSSLSRIRSMETGASGPDTGLSTPRASNALMLLYAAACQHRAFAFASAGGPAGNI